MIILSLPHLWIGKTYCFSKSLTQCIILHRDSFRNSPVQSVYINCSEPFLYHNIEKLSFHQYYRILSHSDHPLHHYLLNTDIDHQHLPSFLPRFGFRIRNIIHDSPLEGIEIKSVFRRFFSSWQKSNVTCIDAFANFGKQYQSFYLSTTICFSSTLFLKLYRYLYLWFKTTELCWL